MSSAKNLQPSQGKQGNIVAIVAMFFLFAMISFVTNLAAPPSPSSLPAFKTTSN